jgi:hypothetical protein
MLFYAFGSLRVPSIATSIPSGGALPHQLVKMSNITSRMWPPRRRR